MSNQTTEQIIMRIISQTETLAGLTIVVTDDTAFLSSVVFKTLLERGHLPSVYSIADGLTESQASPQPPRYNFEIKRDQVFSQLEQLVAWDQSDENRQLGSTNVCDRCLLAWQNGQGHCANGNCPGAKRQRVVPLLLTTLHHDLCSENNGQVLEQILHMCRACNAKNNRRPLVVFVPPEELAKLPTALTRTAAVLETPTITREELRTRLVPNFLNSGTGSANPRIKQLLGCLSPEFPTLAADQMSGMTRPEARAALYLATSTAIIEETGDPEQRMLEALGEHKMRVLRQSGGLTVLDPVPADSCGGMPLLREWLVDRVAAFSPAARAAGVPSPKGLTLLGPPGTGKSLLARIVGSLLNWPTVRMDIGAMFGGLVGETEANIRRALATIDAVAPATVLIDEADKAFGNILNSNDGGTGQRMFGSVLSYLQDRSTRTDLPPVFFILTMNRTEGVPPELLRKGRIDEVFFVDLPTSAERQEIFAVHLRRAGVDLTTFDLANLAAATSEFSGAEIEAAVNEARMLAFKVQVPLEMSHVHRTCTEIRPQARTYRAQIEAMRLFAEGVARRASPPETMSPRVGVVGVPSNMGFPGLDFDDFPSGDA